MKSILLAPVLALGLMGGFASADEQTCGVKGMHCTGCTESVTGKVCVPDKYTTCEVKITDEKKELGEIRLVTKDAKEKVDLKALKATIKDAGYELQKCTAGKAKG